MDRAAVLIQYHRNAASTNGDQTHENNTAWSSKTAELIPGLPNDASRLCIARVGRVVLSKLRHVCRAWKQLCESEDFHNLRVQINAAEAWIYVLSERPLEASFKAFDPKQNKWRQVAPMPKSQESCCWQGFACVGIGPRLLIMGGSSGVVSGDVIVYHASTNLWSKAESMNTPRSWFAAAVLGDLVYVAGGQGTDRFLNSVEVYDSKRDTWSFIPSMSCVRSSCYGLALNGKFWVVGGENVRNQYEYKPKRSSAEVYDPATGQWSLIPEMWLNSHKVPGPNTVYNEKLLFVHQSKLMMYEEGHNVWSAFGDLSGDVYGCRNSRFGFACENINGELYIIGGRRISKYNRYFTQFLNTNEVCNLLSQPSPKWRNLADMGDNEGNILASAVVML